METTPKVDKPVVDKPKVVKDVKKIILKNTAGETMKEEDYFFGGKAHSSFHGSCGLPVEREDLIAVFNKIFNPKDNILFYKAVDKEVYIVIIPLKISSTVSDSNESLLGDFQKHALSFINEGSVNVETLKMKLKRIVPFIKYTDR